MLISRTTNTVATLFFTLLCIGLLMYVILAFYTLRSAYQSTFELKRGWSEIREVVLERSKRNLKYILFETNSVLNPSLEGQKLFKDYQCPQFNCFMTANHSVLRKKEEFDAVVVNVTDLAHFRLPVSRPRHQRYVFYAMEPSDNTPICRTDADNFFNYTWTYKLSSDILSPFYIVQDLSGNAVAPRIEAKWSIGIQKSSLKEEDALNLKNKSLAVAVILKSCKDNDGKIFAYRLSKALRLHNLNLNFFGCQVRDSVDEIIAREYFFVLVTTESVSQDYVPDKVLKAYWNNAVPIIRAKSDLNNFLPPGSYINAHLQTPEHIAAIVHYSINNPITYQSFFKWRNYYTFRRRQEFEGICQLCSLLHSGTPHSTPNLRDWWQKGMNAKCGYK